MPRIAIVDHASHGLAPNLVVVLNDRGHTSMQFYQQNPQDVANSIIQWEPNLVLVDLCFEGIDDPLLKDNWWGINILRLLKSDPRMQEVVLAADSKHMDSEIENILSQIGISKNGRVRPYSSNINLLEIVIQLEKLLDH